MFNLSSGRGDEERSWGVTYSVSLLSVPLCMDGMLCIEWGTGRAIATTEMAERVSQKVRIEALTSQNSKTHSHCKHILLNIFTSISTDPDDIHVKVCLTGGVASWRGGVVRDRQAYHYMFSSAWVQVWRVLQIWRELLWCVRHTCNKEQAWKMRFPALNYRSPNLSAKIATVPCPLGDSGMCSSFQNLK